MKKNLLTVLILVLLIVNIVLNAIMMINVLSTNKKTSELVTNIATVMNLELTTPGDEEEDTTVSIADTSVVTLGEGIMFPLAIGDDGQQHYVIFDVALSLNTKHEDYETYSALVSDNAILMEDAITKVVSSYTEEDFKAELDDIRAEILKAIQDMYQSDFIYNIAISNVKYG